MSVGGHCVCSGATVSVVEATVSVLGSLCLLCSYCVCGGTTVFVAGPLCL